MEPYNEILFEEVTGENGNIGLITLNRPQALNALNHTMILAMHAKLQTWAIAKQIKAVIIRAAEGRAFCAGGDLRALYEGKQHHYPNLPFYFRDEYHLNRFIFHFPKPYIAWLDGITMGGGAGISIHGSHRIATDRLLFAMPETGIGFFPDVGGTYFLPRIPQKLGYYLGLTGARLQADDCVALQIAHLKTQSNVFPDLLNALLKDPFMGNAHDAVTHIINQFNIPISPTLPTQQDHLTTCFSEPNIDAILKALEQSSQPICQETLQMLAKKSPSSLKVTLKALQLGEHLNFDDCMQQEYRLVCRFLKEHDFFEGIRAILIDKDQAPNWHPAQLKSITEQTIDDYFAPLSEELA